MANPLPIIALVLATSVILSGAHAKDLAALPGDTVKSVAPSDQTQKLVGDLHNHIDKGGKTLIKAIGDTPQADSRSLRLRDKKQISFKGQLRTALKKLSQDITLHIS